MRTEEGQYGPLFSSFPPSLYFFHCLLLFFLIQPYYKLRVTDYVQNRRIIIISRLTLLDEHFLNRNRPFKLFKSQDCCNVWEYQKGTYYRDMRWILKYKVKIDIFLPEMLCIVVLAAENGETEKFEGFYIQSFDIPIHFLLIWVGALCSILLFSSNSLQQRHMVSRYYIKYLLL